MTQEEKARAYDEALKKLHEIITIDNNPVLPKEIGEFLFPQLTESDDERIREDLIGGLMWQRDNLKSEGPHDNSLILPGFCLTVGEQLAYLEKQKENIEKEYVFRPLAGTNITVAVEQAIRRAMEGDHLVLAFNGWYVPVDKHATTKGLVDSYDAFMEKQKEQKPAEFTHHEVDESLVEAVDHQMEDDGVVDDFVRRGIDDIVLKYAELGAKWQREQKPAEIDEYKIIKKHITEDVLSSEVNKRLKECGWYVTDERPAEWNEEENEKQIRQIERIVKDAGCSAQLQERIHNWLKSLRSSWKPSREQMRELYYALTPGNAFNLDALKELYEQLKKLM